MKTYQLTDGNEVFETREMAIEEFKDAQHKSVEATDGAIWWAETKESFERTAAKSNKPRLVIVINGGCVVNVYASEAHEVEILDCQDIEKQSPGREVDAMVKESTSGLKEIY